MPGQSPSSAFPGFFDEAVKKNHLAFYNTENYPCNFAVCHIVSYFPESVSERAAIRHSNRPTKFNLLDVFPNDPNGPDQIASSTTPLQALCLIRSHRMTPAFFSVSFIFKCVISGAFFQEQYHIQSDKCIGEPFGTCPLRSIHHPFHCVYGGGFFLANACGTASAIAKIIIPLIRTAF